MQTTTTLDHLPLQTTIPHKALYAVAFISAILGEEPTAAGMGHPKDPHYTGGIQVMAGRMKRARVGDRIACICPGKAGRPRLRSILRTPALS
jgi:hypothetical protein